MIAKDKLLQANRNVTLKFFEEQSSPACIQLKQYVREKTRFLASKKLGETYQCFGMHIHLMEVILKKHVKLCPSCMPNISSVDEGCQQVWNDFPKLFGLPDWETLRSATRRRVFTGEAR